MKINKIFFLTLFSSLACSFVLQDSNKTELLFGKYIHENLILSLESNHRFQLRENAGRGFSFYGKWHLENDSILLESIPNQNGFPINVIEKFDSNLTGYHFTVLEDNAKFDILNQDTISGQIILNDWFIPDYSTIEQVDSVNIFSILLEPFSPSIILKHRIPYFNPISKKCFWCNKIDTLKSFRMVLWDFTKTYDREITEPYLVKTRQSNYFEIYVNFEKKDFGFRGQNYINTGKVELGERKLIFNDMTFTKYSDD